jgi:hypothetical protein
VLRVRKRYGEQSGVDEADGSFFRGLNDPKVGASSRKKMVICGGLLRSL